MNRVSRGLIPLLVAVCVSTAVHAQNVDVTVHPDSQVPPKCSAFDAAYLNCSMAKSAAAKIQQQLKERVGQMIADGKCPDAYRTALSAGDFDVAAKVKGLCSDPAGGTPTVQAAAQ